MSTTTRSRDPNLNLKTILEANLAGGTANEVVLDDLGARILRLAPNAIEWCTNPALLDSPTLYEYQKSYQTIRDYFELRCPICNPGGTADGQPGDCWGKSRLYLESEVLLVWNAANAEDTCPKCGTTRSELVEDGLGHSYNQLHLVVGMRAGKSLTAALIGTYCEHVYVTLGHTHPGGIHGYFGITPAEQFEMTFLASNQVQSEDTIWAKYTGFRRHSPWYKNYVAWIKIQQKEQSNTGMLPWRYEEGVKKIDNEHPNIRLVINALNSNSSGQAGRTRVCGFVDELARMKQTASAMGAEEIYRTIEASLRTIRSRVKLYGCFPWMGSMVSVTSPIARNDVAMRLMKQSVRIPDMYARQYATWEFNPKEPRRNFDSDFIKDPIGAARDFGANPPGAEHPLIHDENRFIRLAVNTNAKPRARFAIYGRGDPTGQKYVAVKLVHADRMFERKMPRVVVFDAGKNFDAFTGVAAHGEYRTGVFDADADAAGGGTTQPEERLVTVYDWIFRVVPEPGTEVWFDSIILIMKALKQYQYTAFGSFDHWNSVQLIQALRELGIPSEQQTLANQDFIEFAQNAFEGRVELLPPLPGELALADAQRGRTLQSGASFASPLEWLKPQEALSPEGAAIAELCELQRDPDTGKVHNPQKGEHRGVHSDDLARVVVHANKLIQHSNFAAKYDDRSTRAARKRAEFGGAKWQSVLVGGSRGGNKTGGRGW